MKPFVIFNSPLRTMVVVLCFLSNANYTNAQCATVLNAGGLIEVCSGESVNVFAEIDAVPFNYNFEWLENGVPIPGEGGIGDNALIGFTPSMTTTITVRATHVSNPGCAVLVDNVRISVRDGATIVKCTIIDDFSEPGTSSTIEVQNPGMGGPTFATVTRTGIGNGGILGNTRTNNLWFVSGPFGSRADILQDNDMFLPSPPYPPMTPNPYFGEWFYSSSNDDGNESNSELVWDANGAGLNWDGLCDCENDPTAAFRFYDYFADQSGVLMTWTLTDGSGNTATINRNMPGSTIGSYNEQFALVNFNATAGFDWCEIDKISLFMNTNNISVDFKFRQLDFCKSIGFGLGDGDRKMCLGECIKLDTIFNMPMPAENIPGDSIDWVDNNGNPLNYDDVVCITNPGIYNYMVTVTDELGCQSIFTQTFTICDTPSISISDEEICPGDNVTLMPNVSGGNSPYSYNWTPSTGLSCTDCLNPIASPGSTTTYTLTVGTTESGDNGGKTVTSCYSSEQVTVTVLTPPSVSISGDNILCDNIPTTEICAVASGVAPITYLWSTTETSECIDVGAGTYGVTVTDGNGCKGSASFTVTSVPGPNVNVTANPSQVCDGDQSQITASASSGTGPYNYSWNTGQTGSVITVTPSTPSSTYTVTVTDNNGCQTTGSTTVNVAPDNLTANVTTVADMCDMALGQATANPSNGTPPYSYNWSNGGTTQTITGLLPGTYTVTVTDAGTCEVIASGTVDNLGAPSVSISGGDPICEGQSTMLTANISGGMPPYNVMWSPGGQTTNSITVSPTSTTIYTVSVVDDAGCSGSDQKEVIVNDAPELVINPSSASICEGQSTSLSAVVNGGTPTFTYSWMPTTGLSCTDCPNPSASPLVSTTYTLMVSDANGCTDVAMSTITVNENPSLTLVSKTDETCGDGNGSITVSASDGTGPYSYEWNTTPIQTSATATGLSAGTYTVVVTDQNGCTASLNESILNIGGPNVVVNNPGPICEGQSATITATASGGTPGYNYMWSPGGATTPSITVSPTSTTTYTVVVTDQNGCTNAAMTELVVNDNPEIVLNPVSAEICNGQSASLLAQVVGGTGPMTYLWTPSTGLSCTDCPNPSASPTTTTTYNILVTDNNGCTDTENITVTVNPNPSLSLVSKTDEDCGMSNGSITVSASGGSSPYNYEWNTNPIQTGATATGLSAGTYTVVVTDQNGCTASLTESIQNIGGPNVVVNNPGPICEGQSATITATASGGTPGYNYMWSPGGATTPSITVSPTSTTTYTVVVTDQNGCTNAAMSELVVNDKPEIVLNPLSAEICNGQSASLLAQVVGGTGPMTYLWSPATGLSCTDCPNPNASPTTTTTYNILVTDNNGCTDSESVTVTVNPNPSLSLVSKTDEDCGMSNGSITVSASGGSSPYNYEWDTNPIQTGATATGLSAGTYTVVVTDQNGCTASLTESIQNIGGPNVNITGERPICEGESLTLTANASGGTPGYNYSWMPGGATTPSITVSPTSTTTYTVVVTDQNGCSASDNVEVTVYDSPTAIVSPQSTSICQGQSANITTTVVGGTPTFTYVWTPTAGLSCTDCPNPTASPTTSTTYTLVVTDQNGCSDEADVVITVNPNPNVNLDSKVNEDCGMSNGSITVIASGGTPGYTYSWNTNPVQTGATASGLSAGTYTVVVTDQNGCSASLTESIINENGPTVSITGSGDPDPSCIGDNVTLTANPQPFPGNYSYLWSNGLGTGMTATVNNVQTTQDYRVTVTDNNTGCSAEAVYTLEVVTCSEVTHDKTFISVTQTGLNTYDVNYQIVVENIGTGDGEYNLLDSLAFDPDVVVNSVAYQTDAPGNPGNPGPINPVLDASNRYELAIGQTINDTDPHTYTLVVGVTLDLNNPPQGGNGQYDPCLEPTADDYVPANGLYNLSILDTPTDVYDERDEACGELPIINHTKSGPSVTQTGPRAWDVTYTITVTNSGYGPGDYSLVDRPDFDDDVEYNLASYTTNAPGNAGNPGPQGLFGQGPWTLASTQNIAAGPGTEHVYTITIPVTMDLENPGSAGDELYTSCGNQNGINDPEPGEGLYNQSELDVNNDGIADETDEVCGDLPYVVHEKTSATPISTGPNAYLVNYTITVTNLGGADGQYDLEDIPGFDDDFTITGVSYTTNAPGNAGNPGPQALALSGPWNLADDQVISAGPGSTHTFNLAVNVTLNLDPGDPTGDNSYTACGEDNGINDPEAGEGLYNESRLDVNNDGIDDEVDETCQDVPYIEHEKTLTSISQNADDTYNVSYQIVVTNNGAVNSNYGLFDTPNFDDDVVILSAEYSSTVHALTALPATPPVTGWQLADNQTLNAGGSHTYTLNLVVEMDLNDPSTPGDGLYTECGNQNGTNDPQPGEGLYNVAGLDVDNDDIADQFDDACGDLPFVTHYKEFISATYNSGNRTYDVVFRITVENNGGATGQYDLIDQIDFENDFVVNSSEYDTDAPGHPANGSPMSLVGTTWTLANDQNIIAGAQHTYEIRINVKIDLSDPASPGDEIYTPCGFSNGPNDPQGQEGLYNMSRLDRTNDGTPEEEDEACGDVEIVDLALTKMLVGSGPFNYDDPIPFTIEVTNQGNIEMTNIVINDYMPDGYYFQAGDNAVNWSQVGPGLLTYNAISSIQPNNSVQVNLVLRLDQSMGERSWYNYAEIASMQDAGNNDRSGDDIDSSPNSNTPQENNVTPGSPDDDNIYGGGPGVGEDEDDHDPAGVPFFDLALIKQPAVTGPYSFGQSVPFDIKVYNQGNISATDIRIFDYVPEGLQYDVAQNFPLGWSYTGAPVNIAQQTIATITPLAPGDSLTVRIWFTVINTDGTNPDAWTNYAEIESANDDNGQPGQDIDSTPNGNPNDDEGGQPNSPNDDRTDGVGTPGDDEDDHDPAILDIFDLALRKTVATPVPYAYGDTLDFDIWVFNQGNIIAEQVEITDYVPVGYNYLQNINTGWSVGPNPAYTIPQILPGDSQLVTIRLVLAMTAGGVRDWMNYAEVTAAFDDQGNNQTGNDIDSNPGSDGTAERAVIPGGPGDNDIQSTDKGGEEDDHDPAEVEVFDLAQIVMIDSPQPYYRYGDDITFNLTITNQGNEPATDIKIVDYIPDGYIYNPADNPMWSQFPTNTPSTLNGLDLLPGETTVIQIILELKPTDDPNGWVNVTEIESANGENGQPRVDIDSAPDTDEDNDAGGQVETFNDDRLDGNGVDDEDDHDPARPRIYDLALIKYVTTPEPFSYGQALTFEFLVVNQGNVPSTNIEITDTIPEGYSFVPGGFNAGWSGASPEISYIIADTLFEKDTARIQVELILERTSGAEGAYTNLGEITAAFDTLGVNALDADSDPDFMIGNDAGGEPGSINDDRLDGNGTDDEDDHDPARIIIHDLALRKQTSTPPPYRYQQTVTMDLWVYNQGNEVATQIELKEYLPIGFEYLSSNNGTWSYDALGRVATLTNLISSIQPGDSALVQIDLRLVQAYSADAWDNFAEISDHRDINGDPVSDIDSTPDDMPDNDEGGEPNGPTDDEIDEEAPVDEDDHDPFTPEIIDLALNKRVENKQVFYLPGDTVPFYITVYNQGNVPVQNILVKDYIPQGFSFNNTIPQNLGWAENAGNLEYVYAPILDAQDSARIDLYLVVEIAANPTIDDWRNYAEIAEIRDTSNLVRNADEADSNPNSDAPHERAVRDNDDGDPNDDNVLGDYVNEGEDEDDHDPEEIEVTGALGDYVWKDLNGNGLQDPGEPGVQGVIARIYECDGALVATDTTDVDGRYFFDFLLPLRSYYVAFDIAPLNNPDCVFTFPNEGSDDEIDSDVNAAGIGPCTFIEPGERDTTYDAGLVELASVGDFVWHDLNGDGIQDLGEPGIEGVTVNLFDSNGNFVDQRTTNIDGYYLFDDLYPIEYYLEFEFMNMWTRTDPNIGGDDALDSDVDDSNGPNTTATFYLAPGDEDLTWDLGLFKCTPIGDFVWFDLNANGRQDPAENGINGVRIYLYDEGGNLVAQQVSRPDPYSASGDGYFKFCVGPGTYFVSMERPGHLAASDPFVGIDPELDSDITHDNGLYTTYLVTVTSGDMRCDIDGGFHAKATMGDRVWYDENANGIQDASESRLSGVVVSAYNTNGLMLDQSVSDQNGQFYMDGLSTGDYYLKFDPPSGYSFTHPDAGQNDEIDSDVNNSNGPRTTALYRVAPGEHQPNVDAGLVSGILPIELLDFRVRLKDRDVKITWSTATEINTDYFEVQRRHESEASFTSIGMQKGAGTVYTQQDYLTMDKNLNLDGVYYYRLRQVDIDGTESFSDTRSVEINNGWSPTFTIYPNPVSHVLNLNLENMIEEDLEISIVDQYGVTVNLPLADASQNGHLVKTVDVRQLSSGVYTIQISQLDKTWSKRFTKINTEN